jgi:hypothetical protein
VSVWPIRSSKICQRPRSASRKEIIRFQITFFDLAPRSPEKDVTYYLISIIFLFQFIYIAVCIQIFLERWYCKMTTFYCRESSAIVISIRRRRPGEDPQAWLPFYRVSRKAGWEIAEVDSRCESDGRELARSSGRVTLKISSLLLKPDFFLVILSELRRPLRSVRFFCRFCNI